MEASDKAQAPAKFSTHPTVMECAKGHQWDEHAARLIEDERGILVGKYHCPYCEGLNVKAKSIYNPMQMEDMPRIR